MATKAQILALSAQPFAQLGKASDTGDWYTIAPNAAGSTAEKVNTDIATATESVEGIVELATSTEVESGWSSAAEKVVRSSHLRLKVEGGGIVLKGTSDPTSGGANTGADSIIGGKSNDFNAGAYCAIFGELNSKTGTDIQEGSHCLISGKNNYNNSGNYTSISGWNNHTNSGRYTSITGNGNHSNTGFYCQISGLGNNTNTGSYTTISGGGTIGNGNHTNSGSYCSISGRGNNTNSGSYCSISGGYNYGNSGHYCLIAGGNWVAGNHNNSGDYCSISGRGASSNALDYARIHGGGSTARIIDLVAQCSTANTTPKAITLGGVAEGAAGSLIIPADTAWAFRIDVVAIDVTNGFANSKKFSFDGIALNDGGTVTVSSATSGTDAALGTFTGSVAISADTTNDALRIMATGIGTDTIRWTAQVNLTQVD